MLRRTLKVAPALINQQSRRGLAIAEVPNKIKEFMNADSTKRAMRAALVELTPPTPAEIPKAIRDGVRLFTRGNWRQVTIREAWLNTLVTTEVICWFFLGEVLGKGTIVGYQV